MKLRPPPLGKDKILSKILSKTSYECVRVKKKTLRFLVRDYKVKILRKILELCLKRATCLKEASPSNQSRKIGKIK